MLTLALAKLSCIKLPEVYRQAYVYPWVNIVALLAVHLVHVNFTWQYSGYVYFVTIATVVAHYRQTTNTSNSSLNAKFSWNRHRRTMPSVYNGSVTEWQTSYLECFTVESDSLLRESLFTLDISEVVKWVGVGRTQSQRRVVTFLSIFHVSLLLQSVRQVTVRIREVGLQFDGTTVRVNCQVNQPSTSNSSPQCNMRVSM